MRLLLAALMGWLASLSAGTASGQGFPEKPIRFITSAAGSGVDVIARQVGQALAVNLGQAVIVDNRASGFTPGLMVSKAPPDGYTLLLYGSTMWITPLLQSAPYDPVRDFSPITKIGFSPNVLVVHPSLPVKSVRDLIAFARARPGQMNEASVGNGTSTHLGAELFKSMAHVSIVRVPYKSGATAMVDLIAGYVDLAFSTAANAAPHVKAGLLRALAVTSAKPSSLVPGLPTVAAAGLAGFESGANYVLFAPANTPASVINRLNQETQRVLQQTELKQAFLNYGVEAGGSSSEELAATVRTEMARLGKIIKDAGIRGE